MKNVEETYKRLAHLLKDGCTYEQAAKTLNKEGCRTARGLIWRTQNVASWVFTRRKHPPHARISKRQVNGSNPAVEMNSFKNLSANKKLSLIKQIVMGLHQ